MPGIFIFSPFQGLQRSKDWKLLLKSNTLFVFLAADSWCMWKLTGAGLRKMSWQRTAKVCRNEIPARAKFNSSSMDVFKGQQSSGRCDRFQENVKELSVFWACFSLDVNFVSQPLTAFLYMGYEILKKVPITKYKKHCKCRRKKQDEKQTWGQHNKHARGLTTHCLRHATKWPTWCFCECERREQSTFDNIRESDCTARTSISSSKPNKIRPPTVKGREPSVKKKTWSSFGLVCYSIVRKLGIVAHSVPRSIDSI